jgi:hypothetical protein
MTDPIIIASYARTPMGGFQGALSGATAVDLGVAAVKAAVERAGVDPAAIDRIYMGCVLPAGLGQAPARQAALGAGLPHSVEATTINKMCGSGMQAAIMGYEALAAGTVDVVIAGGMESMTNAPFLLQKHRGGARIGHDTIIDSMMMDGLEDAYDKGKPMGAFAEDTARDYQFSRAEQDAFAVEGLRRANAAVTDGHFTDEIVPVTVKTRGGDVDACQRRREIGSPATSADRRHRRPCHCARAVYHRSRACDPQGVGNRRMEHRGCRPVRGQRSVRRRRDDRDARLGDPAREAQRERWRDRARPSDWRIRRADHHNARRRAEGAWAQAWRRGSVHRRWRSDSSGGRANLSVMRSRNLARAVIASAQGYCRPMQ